MDNKLFYLASPFSHPDPEVQRDRYKKAMLAGVCLKRCGMLLLEPIVSSFEAAQLYDLPTDYLYWKAQNDKWVEVSDGGIIVLMIDGWEQSKGVTYEIKFAESLGRNVQYALLDPEKQEVTLADSPEDFKNSVDAQI